MPEKKKKLPHIDITKGTVQGRSVELNGVLELPNKKGLVIMIIYGHGGKKDEEGDHRLPFEQVAKYLMEEQTELLEAELKKQTELSETKVIPIAANITNKDAFFKYLEDYDKTPNVVGLLKDYFIADHLIAELHILSHAYEAGLSLGYGLEEEEKKKLAGIEKLAEKRKGEDKDGNPCIQRVMSYENVLKVDSELLTDHLLLNNDRNKALQKKLKQKFTKDAFIKIWGCDSGKANHIFNDTNGEFNVSPFRRRCIPNTIYWEALNEKNTPKPSIAQAIADFFQLNTWGATSGSNIIVKARLLKDRKTGKEIRVLEKNENPKTNEKTIIVEEWITNDKYFKLTGHWEPSDSFTNKERSKIPIKLKPNKPKINSGDKEGYELFTPQTI